MVFDPVFKNDMEQKDTFTDLKELVNLSCPSMCTVCIIVIAKSTLHTQKQQKCHA